MPKEGENRIAKNGLNKLIVNLSRAFSLDYERKTACKSEQN